MSGSSYWPMSAVYVHGTAPFSRIQATATEVSRPPEKAMPTRSPTGSELRTLDTRPEPRTYSCHMSNIHASGERGVGDSAEVLQGVAVVPAAVHEQLLGVGRDVVGVGGGEDV